MYACVVNGMSISGNRTLLAISGRNGMVGAGVMTSLSVVVLVIGFITHDFSIQFVAEHSNKAMPIGLTIAALWGGQAGSLLLWAWILAVVSPIAVWRVRSSDSQLATNAAFVLTILLLFFLTVLIFVDSPFKQLLSPPSDGRGLNPLLWDIAMQIHPPMLTAGYVCFAIPFALSVAGLMRGRIDRDWVRLVRGWMLLAWALQAAGLLLGAWWAYRVLGWGGYWGWDPVENVALIPWLLATAYLHSAIVQERRGMLKLWNVSLAISAYLLAIFGTFIVRSGVLTSVHSFAVSDVGPIFFVFFGLLLICCISLIIIRLPVLRTNNQFESATSREAGFLINNLLLVSVAATTFWGTIFPMISEVIQGTRIAVGAPFYDQVNGPLLLALIILIGIGVALSWRRTHSKQLLIRLMPAAAVALVTGSLLFLLGIRDGLACLAVSAVAFTVMSTLTNFIGAVINAKDTGKSPSIKTVFLVLSKNRRRYGGYVVHLAILMIAIAVIGTNMYKKESSVTLGPGQTTSVEGYVLEFDELRFSRANDVTAVDAVVRVVSQGDGIEIVPGKRIHDGWETQPTSWVGINTSVPSLTDLYLLLTGWEANPQLITLRVIVNPLVGYLWLGGVMYFLGTLMVSWPESKSRDP